MPADYEASEAARFLAKHSEIQGVDVLIRAFARVAQRFPQVRLVLKGIDLPHDSAARLREVEYHPVWCTQGKSHDGAALNRLADIVGNGKDEVVPQGTDRRRPLPGESVRNAASGKVNACLARKHGRQ